MCQMYTTVPAHKWTCFERSHGTITEGCIKWKTAVQKNSSNDSSEAEAEALGAGPLPHRWLLFPLLVPSSSPACNWRQLQELWGQLQQHLTTLRFQFCNLWSILRLNFATVVRGLLGSKYYITQVWTLCIRLMRIKASSFLIQPYCVFKISYTNKYGG